MSALSFVNSLANQKSVKFTPVKQEVITVIPVNSDVCEYCNLPLVKSTRDNYLICNKCQVMAVNDTLNYIGTESSGENNKYNNYVYIDSKCLQEKKTEDDLLAFTENNTLDINRDLIYQAISAYKDIQSKKLLRGHIRTSVMCVCLLKVCEANNFYVRLRDLVNMFHINRAYLAKAHKLVNLFIQENIVEFKKIQTNVTEDLTINNIEEQKIYNVLVNNFALLGIERTEKFVFVYKLVKFLVKYELFTKTTTFTKCIAAIYLTMNATNSPISKKFIYQKLNIAMYTFLKLANNIIDFAQPLLSYNLVERKKCRRLRNLFKKHNVPLLSKYIKF